MGADQQFCLRWNNFHTNITSAFESLRDDEDFVDITLACEGRQIKAHKMVLSACSPYFRSLLRGNPCKHPIVFLKDVTFANLTSILDFMYHGEVNVSHNELATFLKTAEALRVRGLAEDEKKRDGDTCTESSSPPPPRDPPEPCSPGRPDDPPGEGGGGGSNRISIGDSRSSGGGGANPSGNNTNSNTTAEGGGPPPAKRQRRRSGAGGAANISSVTMSSSDHQSIHDQITSNTSASCSSSSNNDLMHQHLQSGGDTTVRESVKNEPEDYVNDEDEMLGPQQTQQQQQHHQQQQQQQQPPIAAEDIKLDGFPSGSDEGGGADYTLPGDSVSISSRSQAAMQQLQDTFNTFIPGMGGQNPGFLQHSNPSGSEHSRPHPSFSLEGVQGLPGGISTLPGPSMSQAGGGSSQDATGQGIEWSTPTTGLSIRDNNSSSTSSGGRKESHTCPHCDKVYTARCNLSRHIRDQHSVADPSSVVCPVCGKNCRNRSNALTHLYRTHHITSKQLRTEAGVLFNAQQTNSHASGTNLQSLLPTDLDVLVPGNDDQEPPTFSFEEESFKEEEGLQS